MTTYHVNLRRAAREFVAECVEVPGCVSNGASEAEAIENLKEAITAWTWDAGRVLEMALTA